MFAEAVAAFAIYVCAMGGDFLPTWSEFVDASVGEKWQQVLVALFVGYFVAAMPKGDLTREELKRYDGSNVAIPVLIAAKGRIFDVTKGRDFYGKGGPYNCFAGIDCSRALAKVSLDPKDLNAKCADLYAAERDVLNDWVRKFEDKYPEVGIVLDGTYDGPP